MARSSLIPFHRVLITAGILFCGGFAIYSWIDGQRVLASIFVVLTVVLVVYLWNLSRVLGYRDRGP